MGSCSPPATGIVQGALIGRRDRRGVLRWLLPKGHIEDGEAATDTAVREVAEETGISGHIIAELGTVDYWFTAPDRRVHKTVHHYLMSADGGELRFGRRRGRRGGLGSARRGGGAPLVRRRAAPGRAGARPARRSRVSRSTGPSRSAWPPRSSDRARHRVRGVAIAGALSVLALSPPPALASAPPSQPPPPPPRPQRSRSSSHRHWSS